MVHPTVNLNEWFAKGFSLYRKNILLLILASVMALVLTAVTLGILAGPMISGLLMIVLRLQRNEAANPADIFLGFGFFLNSVVFTLGWGIVVFAGSAMIASFPVIGPLAALFFAYGSMALLMFGPFLIVDRNMDFWAASKTSYQMAGKDFWPFLSVSAVSGVIGSMGVLLFGIGIVITAPIQACIIAGAYEAVFGTPENMPPESGQN